MQVNLKLKRAVAIALGLIALAAQQHVLALGLGDIDVKSHLGQPLKAKIKVFGADELNQNDLKDGACFKLGDAGNPNQINRVNFSLGNVVGNEATLTVTTTQVIDEPITNLVVIAECGGNIRHDYVLLLDPALTVETEVSAEDSTMPEAAEIAVPTVKKSAKSQPQLAEDGVVVKTKKQNRHKKNSKAKKPSTNTEANANIVLHVPGGNQQESLTLAPEENISRPRLSISGGASANTPIITSNLRLDRQLSYTPDAKAPVPADNIEIQDDVAAMNNRLLHLEKQIFNLQQRNLTLESDNRLKTEQLAQNESQSANLNWLGYALGGALLLTAGYFSAGWWRRRKQNQIENSEAAWADITSTNNEADAIDLSNNDLNNSDDHFFDSNTSQNANITAENSRPMGHSAESTQALETDFLVQEENNDLTILDHADVFLSHGRTTLAIQLLQNHLIDYPKQSVTIWLFLLDLLAKENLQAMYEQTALECKDYFNIKTADFAPTNYNNSTNQALESFPHLALGLQQVWGTPASIVFLDDLIYNNRLEPRAGLEKSLIEELILLKVIAQETLGSAEVIQLDEKKLALKEQKEALIIAHRTEKLNQLAEVERLEIAKAEALAKADEVETKFEFKIADWK